MDVTPDPATLDERSLLVLDRYSDLLAAFNRASVVAMGGTTLDDDGVAIADLRRPAPFLNSVTMLGPLTGEDDLRLGVTERFVRDGSGTVFLWSAWPTPDLSARRWSLEGNPPCMVRPAGGGDVPVPDELEIAEAVSPDDVAVWLDTVVRAYPLGSPDDAGPSWYDERVVDAGVRLFLGRVGGVPVATSAAYTHRDATEVNFVSCLPEWRGRGYGEALTWTATVSERSATAMLLASDHGRPVYERMGYTAVSRFTLWSRTRPR